MLSGRDIKTYSGPISSLGQCFSICHWKLTALQLIIMLNYLFWLLTILFIVLILLVFQRHFSNLKVRLMTHIWNNQIIICSVQIILPTREGVGIYYESKLPLRILSISNLYECFNFEVSNANKISFIQFYRSPSQKQHEFQAFKSNLEMDLDALSTINPFLTIMIGDITAKLSNWYLNDITSLEGSQIALLASQFAMSQLIKEPTQILDNSKSCIDLIFTSQANKIMDSWVHASLHSKCRHQII